MNNFVSTPSVSGSMNLQEKQRASMMNKTVTEWKQTQITLLQQEKTAKTEINNLF